MKSIGVSVTAADGSSIGITLGILPRLVRYPTNGQDTDKYAYLGPATNENIDSLIYALQRLKVHAKE